MKKKADTAVIIDPEKVRYAGLNIRLMTNMLDMLFFVLLTVPLLLIFNDPHPQVPANAPMEVTEAYKLHNAGTLSSDDMMKVMVESGYLQQQMLPKMIIYSFLNIFIIGGVYIIFWRAFNSTPGKMIFGIRIVDAKTFRQPSTLQYVVRFLGYIIATLTLMIGFWIIAFNKRKRGLHDYMAGTVVIYTAPLNPVWEKKKIKYQTYFMLAILVIGVIYISKIL